MYVFTGKLYMRMISCLLIRLNKFKGLYEITEKYK
jgi:hypothetical protein